MTVGFEEVTGGTRITITHAGFGSAEQWDEWLEGTSVGWAQAIADLIVYLHTGVPARRFATTMQSPGMTMVDTDAGIEVLVVIAAGWPIRLDSDRATSCCGSAGHPCSASPSCGS